MCPDSVSDLVSDYDSTSTRGFDWNPRIVKATRPPEVSGLEMVGFGKGMTYMYKEPQTVRSSLFTDFFLENERSLFWSGIPAESWRKEFRPPSLDDLIQHLNRFGGVRSFDAAAFRALAPRAMARMVEYEGAAGVVAFRDWLTVENLIGVRVSPGRSAGLRWKKLGLSKKGDALFEAIEEASRDINGLRAGRSYDTPPCFIAARGKLVDSLKATGKKEGRLVVVPDLKRHLLGSLASVPYSKLVKTFSKKNGGVMIGMSNFDGWYQFLADQIQSRKPLFYICADFSGYDQTVPAPVIAASLERIRKRFQEMPGSKAYWASEYEHLVNTRIAIPSGQLYLKTRGVASGDPWTSQVGSEANWLMHECTFDHLGWDARAWTFGDDVVVAVYGMGPNQTRDQAMDLYSGTLASIFGLEVKVSDSYVTEHLVVQGKYPVARESVKFLSNYFMERNGVVRPVPDWTTIVENMMYPEHNDFDLQINPSGEAIFRQLEDEMARASSLYLVSYFNPLCRAMLERYFYWLADRLGRAPTLAPERWFDLFRHYNVPPELGVGWIGNLPGYWQIIELYNYSGSIGTIEMMLDRAYWANGETASLSSYGGGDQGGSCR